MDKPEWFERWLPIIVVIIVFIIMTVMTLLFGYPLFGEDDCFNCTMNLVVW